MNETKPEDTTAENGRLHESRDANIRAVTLFGVGLGLLTALMLALMLLLINHFKAANKASQVPPSPLVDISQVPPEPRLQVNPEVDLAQLHVREDSLLNNYGWLLREEGIVHIPIDSAINLTLKKGLAARTEKLKANNQEQGEKSQRKGEQP